MIVLSRSVSLADNEVELSAIRAQGAGGQHVNKTSTAIHLRFDIRAVLQGAPAGRKPPFDHGRRYRDH